jgi:hypothetical protein
LFKIEFYSLKEIAITVENFASLIICVIPIPLTSNNFSYSKSLEANGRESTINRVQDGSTNPGSSLYKKMLLRKTTTLGIGNAI